MTVLGCSKEILGVDNAQYTGARSMGCVATGATLRPYCSSAPPQRLLVSILSISQYFSVFLRYISENLQVYLRYISENLQVYLSYISVISQLFAEPAYREPVRAEVPLQDQ